MIDAEWNVPIHNLYKIKKQSVARTAQSQIRSFQQQTAPFTAPFRLVSNINKKCTNLLNIIQPIQVERLTEVFVTLVVGVAM